MSESSSPSVFPVSLVHSSSLAIACSTGGFKGVFVHGVLSALEAGGIRAAAYAAASSSVFPAICAATGQADEIGLRYWRGALHTLAQPGNSMSEVVLHSIADSRHQLHQHLFQPGLPRLLIAVSLVRTTAGAALTQGDGARRLGRKLLLAAARHDRTWANEHLAPAFFDTAASEETQHLTPENIDAVIYASTRMLHAWTIPAWIGDRPYIDASYTCACPALEMARRGYRTIISIASEPGPVYSDMFQTDLIPDEWNGMPIAIIQPDRNLATMGTDFTTVTEAGMVSVYEYGKAKGREFLHTYRSL
ncbi:MAG TPA: hypothetical protein VNG51_20360 [Ktedonobacteraceae bacterium]|nr:hypothetical protein [Ktedonobacteraceae bacterium]